MATMTVASCSLTVRIAPVGATSSCTARSCLSLPSFTGLRGSRKVSARVCTTSARTARRPGRVVCENTTTEHGTVQIVTDATFKKHVLDSPIPVIVDFWAPWCGPCRMIEPLIVDVAVQYSGKARVFKLNTDESPTIATEYGIRSIPTVMVFKGGKKVDTVIGAVPKSTLVSTIDKYIDHKK